MQTRIMAAVVAGALLVGAGFITTIVSAPTVASAQEEIGEQDGKGLVGPGIEFLGDVLSELVGDGTIDQADADAILEAVEAKTEEIRAEREAHREILESALEDDVITKDEVVDLPDHHPIFSERLDEAWEDGELSRDELREFRHPRREAFKTGAHLGSLLDEGGIDSEEYAELADDHPLKRAEVKEQLEQLLEEDGLITGQDLRELRQQFRADRRMANPDA